VFFHPTRERNSQLSTPATPPYRRPPVQGPTRPDHPQPATPATPPNQTNVGHRSVTGHTRSLPTAPPSYVPTTRHTHHLSNEDTDIPPNPAPHNIVDIKTRYPPAPSIPLPSNQCHEHLPPTLASTKQRQLQRTLAAHENKNLLCKYQNLPTLPTYMRPRPPSDAIIESIRLVATWIQPAPNPCRFQFAIFDEAATHNLQLLQHTPL
jgi:hypothetical protein